METNPNWFDVFQWEAYCPIVCKVRLEYWFVKRSDQFEKDTRLETESNQIME
jgi:hypothetical protein